MRDTIQIYYSGGQGNTNSIHSIGGVMSDTPISGQGFNLTQPLTGLTVKAAYGNPPGEGLLRYTAQNQQLSWQAYTEQVGIPQSAAPYLTLVSNPFGHLKVNVTAQLPDVDSQVAVTISNAPNAVYPDLSQNEAYLGKTQYVCLYFKNLSNKAVTAMLWIATQPNSHYETLQVGWDNSNDLPQLLIDARHAPMNVLFSSPPENQPLTKRLNAGAAKAFWLQRTTNPTSTIVQHPIMAALGYGYQRGK